MSYRYHPLSGLGAATPDCSQYIVTADGRCADDAGVHALSWFNMGTGRCETPPPINCEVYEGNLPASCPPGEKLFSGSPTGCKPSASGGGGGAGTQGKPQKAGIGLGVLAIVIGLGLFAASKLKRVQR